MDIAVNSGYFRRKYEGGERTDLACARLCRQGGFSYIDCSPGCIEEEDWQSRAATLAEGLHKEGITVIQSHAPFNRYRREPEDVFREKLRRAFHTAAILGARHIVIHADEYVCPPGEYDSEAACRYAYEFFAPFVELAQNLGIGVAVENLFEDRPGQGRSRCTSTVEEIRRILELFHTPTVGCCWDFGHAATAFGGGMLTELEKIAPAVTCTHVHDNYLNGDLHLPLFLGKTDWRPQIGCLRSVGYPGFFTYEFVYGCMPEEVIPSFLHFQREAALALLR